MTLYKLHYLPASNGGNGCSQSLVCTPGKAGFFGDQADVDSGEDNGVSAFGFRYIDDPECWGLALPTQEGGDLHDYADRLIPFRGKNHGKASVVWVYSPVTKKGAHLYYVDKGPAADTGRCIDLLQGALVQLGLKKEAGVYDVYVTVVLK